MVISDCPACMFGNHSGHEEHWGRRPPDVIDGEFCTCTGDCTERYQTALRQLREELNELRRPKPDATSVLKMLEQRGVVTSIPDEREKCCGTPRDSDGFCVHRAYHPIYVEYR